MTGAVEKDAAKTEARRIPTSRQGRLSRAAERPLGQGHQTVAPAPPRRRPGMTDLPVVMESSYPWGAWRLTRWELRIAILGQGQARQPAEMGEQGARGRGRRRGRAPPAGSCPGINQVGGLGHLRPLAASHPADRGGGRRGVRPSPHRPASRAATAPFASRLQEEALGRSERRLTGSCGSRNAAR